MNKLMFLIYAVFLLWTFLGVAEGTYPVIIDDAAIKFTPRLYGRSTVVYENKMYVYGGKSAHSFAPTNNMYVYDFETDPEAAIMSLVEQKNPGPVCFFCGAVMIDNGTRMMILTKYIASSSPQNSNDNTIVQPHIFDFKTLTWSVDSRPPVFNESLIDNFQLRYKHSTVMGADGLVYTIGGVDYFYCNKSSLDSWYYNPTNNSYGTIANYYINDYKVIGHNAFVLSDTTIGSTLGRNITYDTDFYYPMDEIMVLDTVTKSWIAPRKIKLNYNSLVGREGASSIVFGKGKYVFISGGRHVGSYGSYVFRHNLIINLEKNTSDIVNIEPKDNCVSPRSYGSLVVISEKFLVLGFGISRFFGSSEVPGIDLIRVSEIKENQDSSLPSVFNYSRITWATSLSDIPSSIILPNESMSTQMILVISFSIPVLICIGRIAAAIINRRKLSGKSQLEKNDFYTLGIFNFVWPKRMGETFTVQLYNFLIRFILCIVLLAFMVYFVYSIINSPISTTETFSDKENITIPDIRFCFSGWDYTSDYDEENSSFPMLYCINVESSNTEKGCGDVVVLNRTFGSPSFPGQQGQSKCYMHKSDVNKSVVTKENPTITFYNFGVASTKNQFIYIQFYEAEKNPNRVVYLNEAISGLDVAATDRWLDSELASTSKSDVVNQVLAVYPDSHVSIQFQTVYTAKLDPDYIWNYFGIFSKYIRTSELSITYTDVMNRDTYITEQKTSPSYLGEIQLSPASFRVKTITEKKTLL